MRVYWRVKNHGEAWRIGYLYEMGNGLVRFEPYLGAPFGGVMMSRDEVEWKEAKS